MAKTSVKESILNSRQLKRDVLKAVQASYDIPLAPEMKKEMAFVAYISTATINSAAISCGVSESDIRRWAEQEDWLSQRREHWRQVHETNVNQLQTLAERKASLANQILDYVEKEVMPMITNDEDTTAKDKALTMKYAIEAIEKLTGTPDSGEDQQQKQLPEGLSQDGQNLFVQIFQQFNSGQPDDDGEIIHPDDIIDMLEEEELDEPNEPVPIFRLSEGEEGVKNISAPPETRDIHAQ